jgi:hypothetical protein
VSHRRAHTSERRAALGLLDEISLGAVFTEAYRRPSNTVELAVWESLMSDGYLVFKRGWPDFAVVDPETKALLSVEVKSESDRIRTSQHIVLEALARNGVASYVYKEGEGFSPVGSSPAWRG